MLLVPTAVPPRPSTACLSPTLPPYQYLSWTLQAQHCAALPLGECLVLVQHQCSPSSCRVECCCAVLRSNSPHIPPGRPAIGRKPFRFPSFKPSPQSRLSLTHSLCLSILPSPIFQSPFTRLFDATTIPLRANTFDSVAIHSALSYYLLLTHRKFILFSRRNLKSNWPRPNNPRLRSQKLARALHTLRQQLDACILLQFSDLATLLSSMVVSGTRGHFVL